MKGLFQNRPFLYTTAAKRPGRSHKKLTLSVAPPPPPPPSALSDLLHGWCHIRLRPWLLAERRAALDGIEAFERQMEMQKVPKHRRHNKLLKHTASVLHTRQIREPALGELVDHATVDPLHVANNAWKVAFLSLLQVALIVSDIPDSQKVSDIFTGKTASQEEEHGMLMYHKIGTEKLECFFESRIMHAPSIDALVRMQRLRFMGEKNHGPSVKKVKAANQMTLALKAQLLATQELHSTCQPPANGQHYLLLPAALIDDQGHQDHPHKGQRVKACSLLQRVLHKVFILKRLAYRCRENNFVRSLFLALVRPVLE